MESSRARRAAVESDSSEGNSLLFIANLCVAEIITLAPVE